MTYPSLLTPRSACRVLIMLVLVLPLLLSGCGGSAAGSTAGVLSIWYGTDDPVEKLWSQQLARQFSAAHPHMQVRLTDYSFEDLNTKLQLALSAGNPPDLAYTTPRGPGIPAYVRAHRLRNLETASQRYDWNRLLRPGLLQQYNRPFTYYGAGAHAIVAVPSALAAAGIMVNTRLLKRLHLQIPASLLAFEHDLAVARAAGYTPLGMGNADGWVGDDWYLTLVNALVPPETLAPEQRLAAPFSFKRPPYVRAARILQRWSQLGYFTKDFGGLDAQEGVDQFFHGSTLFQLISSSENSQISEDERQTGLPIDVFAFPHAGGGTVMPVSGYEGWTVPKASRNPSAAIAFIDYVLSAPAGHFLLRQSVLPSHRDVALGGTSRWQRDYLHALETSRPGVYLDAAPIANMNATMEANVQLLLQGYEPPTFLVTSLEEVYSSRGRTGSTARIDGEF